MIDDQVRAGSILIRESATGSGACLRREFRDRGEWVSCAASKRPRELLGLGVFNV